MNIKRLLTGFLGLPIILLVLICSNTFIFDVIIAIVSLIMIDEFYKSFKIGGKSNPILIIGYLSCLYIAIINIIPQEMVDKIVIIGIPIIAALLFMIIIFSKMKITIIDASITLFGIIYIVLFLSFMSKLRAIDNGKLLVWYIFLVAWGSDVLAYVVGKYLGKHRFSEISPKKTIEGCVGGILGSIVFSMVYTLIINNYFGMDINYIYILGISIVLGILSQIGDFAASTIKRYTGIKDYGTLLPGHGGMLDRFDSVIFITPFAYILLTLL